MLIIRVHWLQVIAKKPLEINTHEVGVTSEEFYAMVHNIPNFFEATGFEDIQFGRVPDQPIFPPLVKHVETLASTKPKCRKGANDCDDTKGPNSDDSIMKIMENIINPFLKAHQKIRTQVQQEGLVKEAVITTTGAKKKSEKKHSILPKCDGVSNPNNSLCKKTSEDVKTDQYQYIKEEQPAANEFLYESISDHLVNDNNEEKYSGKVENLNPDGFVMEVYETNTPYQPDAEVKESCKPDSHTPNCPHSKTIKDTKVVKTIDVVEEARLPVYFIPEIYEPTNENDNEKSIKVLRKSKQSTNCGHSKCDSNNSDQETTKTETNVRNVPSKTRTTVENVSNNSKYLRDLLREFFVTKPWDSNNFSEEIVKPCKDRKHCPSTKTEKKVPKFPSEENLSINTKDLHDFARELFSKEHSNSNTFSEEIEKPCKGPGRCTSTKTDNNVRYIPSESHSPKEKFSINSKDLHDLVRVLLSIKHGNLNNFSEEIVKNCKDHKHPTSPSSETHPENDGNVVDNVATFLSALANLKE